VSLIVFHVQAGQGRGERNILGTGMELSMYEFFLCAVLGTASLMFLYAYQESSQIWKRHSR
jgi:hypothetical protein